MQSFYCDYKRHRLHYRKAGQGNPVVLLHGFAEDSRIWDAMVSYLKNDYLLIIPDIPGSGQSALLPSDAPAMSMYAEAIHHILQHEKINPCIMIGHSMGGYITLAFAEKYPALLRAFGLFHSSAYADDEAKRNTRKKAIAFIRENGVVPFLKTSIPGLFHTGENAPGGNEAYIDALIEQGQDFTGEALIQYYQAMMNRPDRIHVLANFPQPILFVLGEHDKAVPYEQGLKQSHIPQQSYIEILRNSGHMGMLEEIERSQQILANFLQACVAKKEGRQHF